MLEKISTLYCFEVLITLFQIWYELKDFGRCINFMKTVCDHQPKLQKSLSPANIKLIIKRQVDAAFHSHSVMYELLTIEKETPHAQANFENEDYNY